MLHIGISGGIAAGKSTLAQKLSLIAENEGYHAVIVPFAIGIRDIIDLEPLPSNIRVMRLNLLFSQWGYDPTKSHLAAIAIDQAMIEYPSTPGIKNRRLLQIIGTDIGRNMLDSNIWVYRVQTLLKERHKFVDFGFSDDLRFDNEAMAADVHVRILSNVCYQERVNKLPASYTYKDHISEQALTLPPLLTIPACFSDNDVQKLFTVLNEIRMLRY